MSDEQEQARTRRARDHAVKEIKQREMMGQSPVPDHCVMFDLRGKARSPDRPTEDEIRLAALTGDVERIASFGMDDIPDDEGELPELFADDPRVRQVDGGWESVDEEER